jgi:hypothetical protein
MTLRKNQRGLGMWGWLFVLGMIGFAAIVVMNVLPLYLNEMKVYKAVGYTAKNDGGQPLPQMRKEMQKRFDVDAIDYPQVSDVKVVNAGGSKALSYDYEARAEIFPDIYVLVHFHHQFPISGGGTPE